MIFDEAAKQFNITPARRFKLAVTKLQRAIGKPRRWDATGLSFRRRVSASQSSAPMLAQRRGAEKAPHGADKKGADGDHATPSLPVAAFVGTRRRG